MSTVYRHCRRCDQRRDVSDLIEVTNTRSGAVSFVCRPAVSRDCLRTVGAVTEERIGAAVDEAGEDRVPVTQARAVV